MAGGMCVGGTCCETPWCHALRAAQLSELLGSKRALTHLSPPLASSCWLRFWLIMVASKLSCCTPLMLSLSSGTYTHQWSDSNTTTGSGCCFLLPKKAIYPILKRAPEHRGSACSGSPPSLALLFRHAVAEEASSTLPATPHQGVLAAALPLARLALPTATLITLSPTPAHTPPAIITPTCSGAVSLTVRRSMVLPSRLSKNSLSPTRVTTMSQLYTDLAAHMMVVRIVSVTNTRAASSEAKSLHQSRGYSGSTAGRGWKGFRLGFVDVRLEGRGPCAAPAAEGFCATPAAAGFAPAPQQLPKALRLVQVLEGFVPLQGFVLLKGFAALRFCVPLKGFAPLSPPPPTRT